MIRLSVSDLESFRYWKNRDDQDVADLVRKLKHEEPPTVQMEAGKAFAKLMENAIADTVMVERTVMPFTFDFRPLERRELALPAIRELKAEVTYATPSGPVTLVGKVDSIHGRRIHDQKLTERWEAENYVDSLQWRAYLDMFNALAFTYDVFIGRYDGNRITIVDYHPVTFYTYPAIREDVQRAVNELAAVVAEHLPEAA